MMPLPVLAAPRAKAETVPRTEQSHPCNRAVARNVRKQIDKEVLKPATKAGVDHWPRGCPFDPKLDLYGKQERQKSRRRGGGAHWTCGICGKVFKNEHYLDLHMERRHMNETPRNGVCLADYCEVYEVCHIETKRRRKIDEQQCDNGTMAIARRRCEESLSKCLPLDEDKSRKLHAKLSKHFCQVLDCRIKEEQKKEHLSDYMPVIVLLILVVLVCFIFFSIVVCCVDYSDDILQFMVESRLASTGFVRRIVSARTQTREVVGLDRTKAI